MPFLPPNQQRQSTEGTNCKNKQLLKLVLCDLSTKWWLDIPFDK